MAPDQDSWNPEQVAMLFVDSRGRVAPRSLPTGAPASAPLQRLLVLSRTARTTACGRIAVVQSLAASRGATDFSMQGDQTVTSSMGMARSTQASDKLSRQRPAGGLSNKLLDNCSCRVVQPAVVQVRLREVVQTLSAQLVRLARNSGSRNDSGSVGAMHNFRARHQTRKPDA